MSANSGTTELKTLQGTLDNDHLAPMRPESGSHD
jgi:hypothetical protein